MVTPDPRKGSEEQPREHDLQTFLRQDLSEIKSEYERIFARSTEDPGTAGDEGEENWAALLREWLPDSYHIVTKGRVLGADGIASPQIDVLVLRPAYPARLLNKKVYLANGVAAAFECKTTLKSAHITEAASAAATVRKISGARVGSPYRELISPPLYGVLAHSHAWKGAASTPRENVDTALEAAHVIAAHPRDLLDVVCVADLACWQLGKMPYMGAIYFGVEWPKYRAIYGLPDEGGAHTFYNRWYDEDPGPEPNPVAVPIAQILQQLAWEDVALRPLADYFRMAGLVGASRGTMKPWPLRSVYSEGVAARLQASGLVNGVLWDERTMHLP